MILVKYLQYHLFSLPPKHKWIAKTFSLPHLFLREWNQEEIRTLPFPRGTFPRLCPLDMIPSQPHNFDHQVLRSPDQVTGVLANQNSITWTGTGTVRKESPSYPPKHTEWLITRDRKVARGSNFVSPAKPHSSPAIFTCILLFTEDDFMWESFQQFFWKSVHGSAFISKEDGNKMWELFSLRIMFCKSIGYGSPSQP